MDKVKRARLERAGWTLGSAGDFLGLTKAETEYVELKLALAEHLRALRREHRLTQAQVAERLASSQSRVAKMEAADRSVSLDLLVKALLALGATPRDVGTVIAGQA
jgi:predicted XRE-type DNA-binding protein